MKSKYLLVLGLLLAVSLGMGAQDMEEATTEKFRYYDEGPLTLDDFVKTYSTDNRGSYMEYGLMIEAEKLPVRNSTPIFQDIPRACMTPARSWMRYDQANSATLKYQQVAFDIVEKYARLMNREMNGGGGIASTRMFFNHYYTKMEREMKDFKEASAEGSDT
ncbi:MAG: hypothetical protein Q4F69_12320, partial [Bacteroidia bacterium]|nr:hypothetical protein [Bacteroidia bacterium]